MSFGERLRLARLKTGMSMAALAGALEPKITAQAVNKYEKGDMMPSSSVLVGLARALDVTLDFLMTSQVHALKGVEFRKRATVTKQDRAIVEGEVIDFLERYLAVESVLGMEDPSTGLDDIKPMEIDDVGDAEAVACSIRKNWHLGDEPIPSMTALLEDRNIRVIEIEGVEKFFGMTCRVKRPGNLLDIPVIVRKNMNVERNRFTMAHELGHALISGCRNGKLEKSIDRCAAAILMPAEHLKHEIGSARNHFAYNELVRLKRLYGVSMWALLMRLGDLEVISPENIKNLYRTPARAWLKSEPEPLALDGDIAELEKPRRFASLVYRAVAEGLIQSGRAAALLKVSVRDVETAVQGPEVH